MEFFETCIDPRDVPRDLLNVCPSRREYRHRIRYG